jgi:hypothetical protein
MTPQKLKEVFAQYRRMLLALPHVRSAKLADTKYDFTGLSLGAHEAMSHAVYMCEEASKFVDEGRIEKAMRWLGFVQGVLWCWGVRSLTDLKLDSMP